MIVEDDLGGQIPKIEDGPWPAFPADLTSIALTVATQAPGTILIFEKMFESRLFFVDKLVSMGARIILCDPHRAVVTGPGAARRPAHGEPRHPRRDGDADRRPVRRGAVSTIGNVAPDRQRLRADRRAAAPARRAHRARQRARRLAPMAALPCAEGTGRAAGRAQARRRRRGRDRPRERRHGRHGARPPARPARRRTRASTWRRGRAGRRRRRDRGGRAARSAEALRTRSARARRAATARRSLPADEALAHVALEVSERPLVVSNVDLSDARVGGLGTDLVADFLEQLAEGAGLTLHVRLIDGDDPQHVLEAIFKALGVALAQACRPAATKGAT